MSYMAKYGQQFTFYDYFRSQVSQKGIFILQILWSKWEANISYRKNLVSHVPELVCVTGAHGNINIGKQWNIDINVLNHAW